MSAKRKPEPTAEELELAQLLRESQVDAAILRSASEKTLSRKLTIVAKDGSEKPGTGRDLLRGLAKIQGLQHVVEEGVRPKEVICKNCGKAIVVGPGGRGGAGPVPDICRQGCERRCATSGCVRRVSVSAARRAAKSRKRPCCQSCAARAKSTDAMRAHLAASQAAMSPDARSKRTFKANASRTPEQRSGAIRRGHVTRAARRAAATTAKESAE